MEYFELSMEESKTIKSYPDLAIGYHNLSFSLFSLGRAKEAADTSDQALEYALLSGNFEHITEVYAMMASLAYEQSNYADSYGLLTPIHARTA